MLDYAVPTLFGDLSKPRWQAKREDLAVRYRRTLGERPWEACGCAICRAIGVEVVLFRASNRNKRRGIHNLSVFHDRVRELEDWVSNSEGRDERQQADLFGDPRAAE